MTQPKSEIAFFNARIPAVLKRDIDMASALLQISVQDIAIEALEKWLGKADEQNRSRLDKKLLRAFERFMLTPVEPSDRILGEALVARLKKWYSDDSADSRKIPKDNRHGRSA